MKKLFLVAALGVTGLVLANNNTEKKQSNDDVIIEKKVEAKEVSLKKTRNISLTVETWCSKTYQNDNFSVPGGGFENTGLTEAEWASIGQSINIALCGSPADEIEVGGN
ncbi:hypothetical protein [Chryseobacterium sp.]|uniref:hypothetical protein n=1 Tax=Chryseobacterium sp. TaxID=1871047 RepID=UPI002896D004|nr:hypothetical protein [Chryseobacterium sp.]